MIKPTPAELRALHWAIERLRSCYEDSQIALKRKVAISISKENIANYEALEKLHQNIYEEPS